MRFTDKLSHRWALGRFAIVAPVLLVVACEVVDLAPLAITQLVISPKDVELEPFETVQFEALGITLAGDTVPTSVDWSATGGEISAEGIFTAAEEGGPYLVSATSQSEKLKDSTKVTVRAPLQEIILTPDSVDLTSGTTAQFLAYGRRKGDSVDVAVSFTATGGSITGDGMYTAGESLGRTLVVATEQRPDYHKNNRKPKVDSAVVHIRLATSSCASISLTPTAATLTVGGTEQFTAQALDAGGSVIQDAEMSWRSNSPEVASVSPSGLVTAVALGTTAIVASSMGCSESANVSVIDESVADGLVTDLMPAQYDTVRLQVGDQYFIDRTYTITDLGPGYQDWLWIRTANDDKAATADDFLTFTLLDSAVVAVAYDRRATTLPDWLQGWPEAPEGIQVSDGASPLRVFYQTHGPGPVVLGGNMAGGAVGAQSMYVVLLLPRSALAPTAVAVTPTAVTLEPGETEAFSAPLQDQLGQPIAGEIVWTATGGAITAAGVYTAGATEGTYEVTATEQATSIVGTAQVTIEAPASGTGTLSVTTTTTGTNVDPDGYTVTVDGTQSQAIGVNGTLNLTSLAVGDHTVELGDVAQNCTVTGLNPRTVSVPFNGTASTTFEVRCMIADVPYSPSAVIWDITFDFNTHDRRAPGSDNWPVTWADDGHQYTSWGDGGGFGGTNSDGRVSLGVARVEGSATSYTGHNVWGGKDPENTATFGGKSYGILSVDGVLFMWVSPGSGPTGYQKATVYRSTDHGASWTSASWDFVQAEGLINPTFLQFGQDYQGARDTYVYIYANHLKDASALKVQKPGEIALMRVPKTAIMDRAQYEFFAGLDGSDNPIWVTDLTQRQPVFEDANGVGWNTSLSYNPGLGRYLLTTEHTATFQGNIGIFDAPEPWGPWTTVLYDTQFGAPAIAASTFFWNFSNKWLSADGKDFILVFTGIGSNDSWNAVRGTLVTN